MAGADSRAATLPTSLNCCTRRLEAAARADQLLAEGDMAGAATWHRILGAIERLQAQKPAEGEGVH